PSARQVQRVVSSSGRISRHSRVTLLQFLWLNKAIQSQIQACLCNVVVRVRHQSPATQALAGQFDLILHSRLLLFQQSLLDLRICGFWIWILLTDLGLSTTNFTTPPEPLPRSRIRRNWVYTTVGEIPAFLFLGAL